MLVRNNFKMWLWLLLILPACLADTPSKSAHSLEKHPHVDIKPLETTHNVNPLVKGVHLGHETDEKRPQSHLLPVIHKGDFGGHGSNVLQPKKGKSKLAKLDKLKLKRKRKQWRLKKRLEKKRRQQPVPVSKAIRDAAKEVKKQPKALTKSINSLKKKPRMLKSKALRRKHARARKIKGKKVKNAMRDLKANATKKQLATKKQPKALTKSINSLKKKPRMLKSNALRRKHARARKIKGKKVKKAMRDLKAKATKKQTKALTKSMKKPRKLKSKALRRKLARALKIKRKKGKKVKGGLKKLKSKTTDLKKKQLRSGGVRFRGRQRITVNRGRPVQHEVNDNLAADGRTHTYRTEGRNGRVRSKMHVTVSRNRGGRRRGRKSRTEETH
ncbi:uncharacterized protein LOC128218690 isoform X1 [Mya arenaria]|uniref:uncharacterized protein LOC128218690 isoform X1 n=1 Tax=Mya arenaria TaxID=6604 RepID=UPI0022E6539D|nr:uncharacterized protein LOC128218690 isoform X1 [Mya arenaria]